MNHETRDMRLPDVDETELSPQEVMVGLRAGLLDGPIARAHAFAEVTVVTRQRVEIINFTEDSPC